MRRMRWTAGLLAGVAATVAGLALGGCSGGTVAQWASATSVGANDYQIVTDVQHLRRGIQLRELRPVQTACLALYDDATTAYSELPTPDHTLTDELNTAYVDDEEAGQDCSAAPSLTSPQFRRFESLLSAGSAELSKAERLLATLAPGANAATGGSGGS